MAHEDLYPAIPSLFEAARRLEPDQSFGPELRKLVAIECRDFAEAERIAGNRERSAQLLKFADEIESATPMQFNAAEKVGDWDEIEE